MSAFLRDIMKAAGENRRLFYGLLAILVLIMLITSREVYELHNTAQNEIRIKVESILLMNSALERNEGSGSPNLEKLTEFEKERLLAADKPSIAAAKLQKSFKSMSLKNNVRVLSERPLKPVESGEYLKIPIEYQIKAGLPAFRDLLSDLHGSSPMIGVEAVQVKKTEHGALEIILTIVGAMRKSQA